MEEILILILNFLLECFFNILTTFLDIPFYWGENENTNTFFRGFWSFSFGLLIGWVSLLIFHKTFITVSYLRITSLVVSPILSGLISRKIAELIHNKKDNVWPERHFWYSFWLCLGYVVIRFVYAQR